MNSNYRKRSCPSRLMSEKSDYFLFWYPTTLYYSQIYSFNSPALSLIDEEKRRILKVRDAILLRNGLNKDKAVLIARGSMKKLMNIAERLEKAINADDQFDTEKALCINNDEDSEITSESEVDSSAENAVNRIKKQPQKASDMLMEKEKSKLKILQTAHGSESLAPGESVSQEHMCKAGNSKATITSVTGIPRQQTDSDTNRLLKKIIEAQNKGNTILSNILVQLQSNAIDNKCNQRVDIAEFECHDGQKVDLGQINRYEPNSFAREFIKTVYGKENLVGKLFSCKGKTERVLFTQEEFNDTQRAVLSKFPYCQWKAVERSLNQFLRDMTNKIKNNAVESKRHTL